MCFVSLMLLSVCGVPCSAYLVCLHAMRRVGLLGALRHAPFFIFWAIVCSMIHNLINRTSQKKMLWLVEVALYVCAVCCSRMCICYLPHGPCGQAVPWHCQVRSHKEHLILDAVNYAGVWSTAITWEGHLFFTPLKGTKLCRFWPVCVLCQGRSVHFCCGFVMLLMLCWHPVWV